MTAYEIAKEKYAALGVDTEEVIEKLKKIQISIHCWQGDDVSGFENPDGSLTGGIQTTGNYPGKARNPEELRADIEKMLTYIPGNHRVSIHANYAETGGRKVDRNELEPKHFQNWIDWAKANNLGLDYNHTLFSHPLSADGFTLSHIDKGVRDFWIEHCVKGRDIAEYIGEQLQDKVMNNLWIPDGFKDVPVDRYTPRQLLKDSLDQIFAKDTKWNIRHCDL